MSLEFFPGVAILLMGVLLVVPWAMQLAGFFREVRRPRQLLAATVCSGLLVTVAFALPAGIPAAALTVPWLVFTLALAAAGVRRLFRRRHASRDAAFTAALLLVPVGGLGIFFSRAGLRPLGFSDDIIFLTGVHFHYAGFALPILAGLTAAARPGWLSNTLVWTIVLSIPLVGLGITFSPGLEIAGAWTLAAACMLLAMLQLAVAWRTRRPAVFAPLAVSSLALVGGMLLAGLYAWGEFVGQPQLDIPTMIQLHGVANAFGFTFCGLWGWARYLEVRA